LLIPRSTAQHSDTTLLEETEETEKEESPPRRSPLASAFAAQLTTQTRPSQVKCEIEVRYPYSLTSLIHTPTHSSTPPTCQPNRSFTSPPSSSSSGAELVLPHVHNPVYRPRPRTTVFAIPTNVLPPTTHPRYRSGGSGLEDTLWDSIVFLFGPSHFATQSFWLHTHSTLATWFTPRQELPSHTHSIDCAPPNTHLHLSLSPITPRRPLAPPLSAPPASASIRHLKGSVRTASRRLHRHPCQTKSHKLVITGITTPLATSCLRPLSKCRDKREVNKERRKRGVT
jgi:hypothetical protein